MELGLHSVIVTDFAMARLPESLSCPLLPFMQPNLLQTVASVLRRSSHTDGACFPGKEQEFLSYRSHQRSGSPPSERRAFNRLLLNSSIWSCPVAFELVQVSLRPVLLSVAVSLTRPLFGSVSSRLVFPNHQFPKPDTPLPYSVAPSGRFATFLAVL